jgi:hypothetical protein
MRPLLIIGLLFLSTFHLHAQSDSSRYKLPRPVTFHFSTGVNVLQNEQLRSIYNTKTLYFWGFGLRLAPVQKSNNLFISLDYNSSSYSSASVIKTTNTDSLLNLGQLVTSVSVKLVEVKDLAVRARAGHIFAIITDKIQKQEGNSTGFKIGIGLERRVSRNQYFHVFLDYDMMKLDQKTYQDYDVVKLGIGVYL